MWVRNVWKKPLRIRQSLRLNRSAYFLEVIDTADERSGFITLADDLLVDERATNIWTVTTEKGSTIQVPQIITCFSKP